MLTRKRFKLQQELENEIPCSMSYEECVEQSQQTSDIHTLTWEITNFNELPLVVDYYEDSEQLVFEATGWCIRTYPNGMSENGSEGWICHVMRRTSTLAPKQNIFCEFGIKDNNGVVKFMAESILKNNDRELGPIKLFPLSEACKIEKGFLRNGIVTMICRMKSIEGTETDPSFPSSTHDKLKIFGRVFTKLALVKEIIWKLPHFSEMPTTKGYYVVSPTFEFDGTTCCLRLYPNGFILNDINYGWTCVELERSGQKKPAVCEIGIMNSRRRKSKRFYLNKNQNAIGPFRLLKRSQANASFHLEGDSITVICKMTQGDDSDDLANQTEIS